MSAAQTARAGARVLGLDLLRGFCAIAVVGYHYGSWHYQFPIDSAGAFPVYTFFVLSGLTMMMVYGPRFASGVTPQALEVFFRARIARLIPMLALAAAGTFLIMVGYYKQDWAKEAISAALTGSALFGLGMPAALSNVTGGWSLGIEAAFYLVFPTLAVLLGRASARKLFIIGLVLLFAQQMTTIYNAKAGNPFWHYYVMPITFAPFFLFGIAISKISAPQQIWYLPLSLGGLAAICGFSLLVPVPIYSTPWAYTLLTALAVAATAAAYFSQIPKWLEGFSKFTGDLSYSLYLTHWITYLAVEKLAGDLGLGGGAKAILFVGGAIGVSYLAHALVEVPARNALREGRRLQPA